jgi:thiol-disulfide isomerase/thioredoxin
MPAEADYLWLTASVMKQRQKYEEAIGFVDQHRATFSNPAELLLVKASSLASLSYRKLVETNTRATIDVFNEVLKADPKSVGAHCDLANYLVRLRRFSDAYALSKQALRLSPDSARIHSAYWTAAIGQPDILPEKKETEIEADITSLLERRGEYPEALLMASYQYASLNLKEKQHDVEERVLARYPTSKEAEWVLVMRFRDFREQSGPEENIKDVDRRHAYHAMLWAFIDRPIHQNNDLLAEAYLELFASTRDDRSVSDVEFLRVVDGLVKFDRLNPLFSSAQTAIALADRKAYLDKAEAIAREGILKGMRKVNERRRHYETEGDFQVALDRMAGTMRDALGWVLFKAGRMGEAEVDLLRARDLSPESISNLNHLGQFYEAGRNLDLAEEFYIKGAVAKTAGLNPNQPALKALYEKRHGDMTGYVEYLSGIVDLDRTRRMDAVLKGRIAFSRLVEPFNLNVVGGGSLASGDLKGKVAVINFWGGWCGWCVAEMPEFQRLSDIYKNDPKVSILTIDNDSTMEKVTAWMQKNKYTFKVLFDDGYLATTGVNGFPTTWFIDKNGRVAFVKRGWSEKLIEEFGWRIEILKNDSSTTTVASGTDLETHNQTPAKAPFTISAIVEPQPISANSRAELLVRIKVAPGFHINANKPDDDYLIATSLTPSPVHGINWEDPIYPAPVNMVGKFSSRPLKVYDGEVLIKVPLVVVSSAVANEINMKAVLRLQACNSESCLPPKNIPIAAVIKLRKRE